MNATFARWLGYENVAQVESWRTGFGSAWANQTPMWLVLALLVSAALAAWFYGRLQPRSSQRVRIALTLLRAAALAQPYAAVGALGLRHARAVHGEIHDGGFRGQRQ